MVQRALQSTGAQSSVLYSYRRVHRFKIVQSRRALNATIDDGATVIVVNLAHNKEGESLVAEPGAMLLLRLRLEFFLVQRSSWSRIALVVLHLLPRPSASRPCRLYRSCNVNELHSYRPHRCNGEGTLQPCLPRLAAAHSPTGLA